MGGRCLFRDGQIETEKNRNVIPAEHDVSGINRYETPAFPEQIAGSRLREVPGFIGRRNHVACKLPHLRGENQIKQILAERFVFAIAVEVGGGSIPVKQGALGVVALQSDVRIGLHLLEKCFTGSAVVCC